VLVFVQHHTDNLWISRALQFEVRALGCATNIVDSSRNNSLSRQNANPWFEREDYDEPERSTEHPIQRINNHLHKRNRLEKCNSMVPRPDPNIIQLRLQWGYAAKGPHSRPFFNSKWLDLRAVKVLDSKSVAVRHWPTPHSKARGDNPRMFGRATKS
jgi:hypothetical protein